MFLSFLSEASTWHWQSAVVKKKNNTRIKIHDFFFQKHSAHYLKIYQREWCMPHTSRFYSELPGNLTINQVWNHKPASDVFDFKLVCNIPRCMLPVPCLDTNDTRFQQKSENHCKFPPKNPSKLPGYPSFKDKPWQSIKLGLVNKQG